MLSFIGISWLTGALTFLALSFISPASLKEIAAQTQTAFTSVMSTLPSSQNSHHQAVVSQPQGTLAQDPAPQKEVLAATTSQQALQGQSQAIQQQLSTTSTNLLHNSSFEQQTNGQPREWNYQLDSSIGNTFISKEGNRSGSFGLKFKGGGTGNLGISQPNVKTVPGRTYTLSAYIKITNAPNTTLKLGFWNEYLNQEGHMKTIPLAGTKDWTRISFTTRLPRNILYAVGESKLANVGSPNGLKSLQILVNALKVRYA